MSGHSKWSTIKRKKQATDAKRGQVFTRLAREVTMAAREGGGDTDANFRLRLAVDKARAANMPKENIQRAIMRGTGELKGEEAPVEVVYEGYAPHGVALLIKTLTDNRNRTVADIRRVMNRQNGTLAEAGAVGWMFQAKGYIALPVKGNDPEKLFEVAVEAGAEDVVVGEDLVEVYTAPDDLHAVRDGIEAVGVEIDDVELSMIPTATVPLDDKDTFQVMRLIDSLEELDDVDQVYSNLDISDEIMARYEVAA
jgi:YebC/PmpR family DNA-binding regulatory protein